MAAWLSSSFVGRVALVATQALAGRWTLSRRVDALAERVEALAIAVELLAARAADDSQSSGTP
jgi:hypothetical protein